MGDKIIKNFRDLDVYRAIGEVQETGHHVDVAYRKGYLPESQHGALLSRYEECGRMLWGLAAAVERSKGQ